MTTGILRCKPMKVAATVLLTVVFSVAVSGDVSAAPAKAHKTDWLHKAKWGVMYHYSQANFGKFGSKEKWDKAINNFDVEGLAKQLDEVGAGYFIITSRHMGLPVAQFKDHEGGKYPTRDLIGDLADALAKYKIRLMLYYPTGMGVNPPKSYEGAAKQVGELSKRYGKKISGWWLDNNTGIAKAQKLIAAAARSGNPDALVAFSPRKGVRRNTPYDDYTAGNTHSPRAGSCSGRFVSGVQWHMLTYMAHNWGGIHRKREQPRFSAGTVAAITKSIVDKGGVITWDTPFSKETGKLADQCWDHLKAIGRAAGTLKTGGKKAAARIPADCTCPSRVRPAVAGSTDP